MKLKSRAWTKKKLIMATSVAHTFSPMIAISFIGIYWIIGMNNVINPTIDL